MANNFSQIADAAIYRLFRLCPIPTIFQDIGIGFTREIAVESFTNNMGLASQVAFAFCAVATPFYCMRSCADGTALCALGCCVSMACLNPRPKVVQEQPFGLPLQEIRRYPYSY